MKEITKTLAICIDKDELKHIRIAYEKMVDEIDLEQMAVALGVLNPKRRTILTPALLLTEIENSYENVMSGWGKPNTDGSLCIDLLESPFQVDENLGFVLRLNLGNDKEDWLWSINLAVNDRWVYGEED